MTNKKQVRHSYVCDECGKPATQNIQQQYHSYSISASGEFQEIDNWEGDTNEFLCDECANNQ